MFSCVVDRKEGKNFVRGNLYSTLLLVEGTT